MLAPVAFGEAFLTAERKCGPPFAPPAPIAARSALALRPPGTNGFSRSH